MRTGVNVKGERVSTFLFFLFLLWNPRTFFKHLVPSESSRFEDDNDYEYEIFSILSIARTWTGILAGKRDSRRHSTTGFSVNAEVEETSYLLLEVLLFCEWEKA